MSTRKTIFIIEDITPLGESAPRDRHAALDVFADGSGSLTLYYKQRERGRLMFGPHPYFKEHRELVQAATGLIHALYPRGSEDKLSDATVTAADRLRAIVQKLAHDEAWERHYQI